MLTKTVLSQVFSIFAHTTSNLITSIGVCNLDLVILVYFTPEKDEDFLSSKVYTSN